MNTRSSGFTLIEILLIFSIMSILAAIILPSVAKSRSRAYDVNALNCARNLITGQVQYREEHRQYATHIDDLDPKITAACRETQVEALSTARSGPNQVGNGSIDADGNRFAFTAWHLRGSRAYEVGNGNANQITTTPGGFP